MIPHTSTLGCIMIFFLASPLTVSQFTTIRVCTMAGVGAVVHAHRKGY
jgi:hypothetical protein